MLADSLHVGEISEPIQNDGGGYSIIRVNSKVKPRQKTFDEAGAEVSNKLQEDESRRLEREWVDRLRLKYPVVEHPEVLSKAFTGPRPDDE
jgi:parvulin-like peptidyl-prolyl isomerase